MVQLIGYCLLLSVFSFSFFFFEGLSFVISLEKHPNSEAFPSSLFIVICSWLWSAGSRSSDGTEIEWETLCPLSSATVEQPLSSCCYSGAAQWRKQLKTVIFSGRRPRVNIQIQSKSVYGKGVHVRSLNFHWKGQKINNTISCRVDTWRAFQGTDHSTWPVLKTIKWPFAHSAKEWAGT